MNDLDLITHLAVRYCLGRQTYATSECAGPDGWLRRRWLMLSSGTKYMIYCEIVDEMHRVSDVDRSVWASFIEWVEAP